MQTLNLMVDAIRRGSVDPAVRHTAARLVQDQREYDTRGEAARLLSFVQSQIRYTGDMRFSETLHDAVFILENRWGDCDDKVILFNSLCESVGIQTAIVAIGVGDFPTHVMAAVLVDGEWIYAEPCRIKNGAETTAMPLGWHPGNVGCEIMVQV